MIRSAAAVLFISLVLMLACVASEQKVDTPPPIPVDTVSSSPPPPPLTPDQEYERKFAELFDRAVQPEPQPAHIATDTAQPLRRAPVHVVRFDRAALPTPILDERRRDCIAYPIPASLSRVRINLLLQPNMEAAAVRLWSMPAWRELFRVEAGTFPVNLWRIRQGVASFVAQARVQAGPGLAVGLPQEIIGAVSFRGGDVLCVEAVKHVGPLSIAYDPVTGLINQPQASVIQNASNDSTPMPGAWTTIGGEAR